VRESDLLARLRQETAKLPRAVMQVAPEQGQLLKLLIQLTAARRVLEIGVFTGYSSLCMAEAMPPGGKLVACDHNEEWTTIARRYWREAGVLDRIDLQLGPALETLQKLNDGGETGSFDLIFIDADKTNYRNYFEQSLQLVRAGGLIVVDNVLWGGSVVSDDDQSPDTVAIREFNRNLHEDSRIDLSLVPIGDGLSLARKR
jgi:predicted O-methyltransferase YrrM